MAVYSAMDGPACKGDQMWQYLQHNGLSRYYRYLGGPNVAVYSAMDGSAITGSKEDKCGSMQYNVLSSYYAWVARRTKGDAMNLIFQLL